jgi:uncharacterized membrane protein
MLCPREELDLVIVLGVGGAVLLVYGLLLLYYGFSIGGIPFWLGAIILFFALLLGIKFGFLAGVELPPIYW